MKFGFSNIDVLPRFYTGVQLFAGIFSVVLGLLVLFGWHTHNILLVQILPAFVPMAYNTAICFVLSGTGLMLSAFERSRITLTLAIIVTLFGFLTLIQHIGHLDFGFDYFLMKGDFGGETEYRVKMALNTALCFVIAGQALIASSLQKPFKWRAPLLGISGAVVGALGTDAFYGYLIGIKIVYGWGNAIPMAVHTAAGFVFLGIGLFALAWKNTIAEKVGVPPWIPLVIGFGVLTATVCLWRAVTAVEGMSGTKTYLPLTFLVIGIAASLLLIWLTAVMRNLSNSRTALLESLDELKRSEEARRKAEDYHSLFQHANDSILIFEPETEIILDVNDKACEIYGFSRDEFIGKSLKDMSQAREKGERQLEELLAEGSYHLFESVQFRSDGTPINFLINSSVIEYQGQQAILSINRDITSRKQTQDALQKNLSLLTSTFEATADGILAVDLYNNIVTSNKKFIEMWDIPKDVQDLTDTRKVTNHMLGLLKNPRDLTTKMMRSLEKPDEISYSTLELKDGRIYERCTQPQMLDGKTVGRVMSFRDITERKQTEEILQDSEARYRLLFDRNPYPIWVYDIETLQFLAVNEEATQHYGYSREEFLKLTIKDIRPPKEVPVLLDFLKKSRSKDEVFNSARHQKKDGTVIEVEVAAQSINFAGKPARIGLVTDVTERKLAEAALREGAYKLRTLLESMSEGLLQVDTGDHITFVNNCFCEMVGYSQEELIGTDWTLLLLDEGRDFIKQVNERRRKGISDRYEIRLKKKSGEILCAIVGGVPVVDADGVVTGSMGVFTDITERKRAEEQLLHDAFHDGLTGLANRTLFMDHLRMAIERGKSRHSNLYAVLYLDFDRFKVINDSLGHAEGDRLLQFIARRLEGCTRTGDLVARLGGDEFVILLSELVDTGEALLVAERILSDLKSSFDLSGREIFVTTSIGITLSTSSHTSAEDMLRDADIAMYRAKAKGKAQYQIFDQIMHKEAMKQLQIETEMRRALERGEFCLHYQPIFGLESRNLVGFEALIRWNHPERGMIPPHEFIPIAEENGLILQLGQWTIHESCRQLYEWQQDNSLAANLTVSVNLSCKEFLQPDLADKIAATLKSTKLDPKCLKFEITESHVMENSERAVTVINRLRTLGIEMSLDDFGTGYSSLSYLHRLPVNYLKIDRSFVSRMMETEENGEIVHTIIKLAQNLKMKVVAEGIETAVQFELLKRLNCEYGQGYFFSKPLEPKGAKTFIDSNIANPRAIVEYPTLGSELRM